MTTSIVHTSVPYEKAENIAKAMAGELRVRRETREERSSSG
ncbi:MAG: hypothetical protein ACXV6K_09265 [Halobacteriota archaeon]